MTQATQIQPQEPNAELIRSLLRFRDDKRDWTSPLRIERTDHEDRIGYPSHLGGETVIVVIDGTAHEFCRWTGRGLFGPTPTMRIAIQDLYCVHPVTYRVREPQRARFHGESPWDALVSSQAWDIEEESAFLERFPDAKTQDEERLTAYLVSYRESRSRPMIRPEEVPDRPHDEERRQALSQLEFVIDAQLAPGTIKGFCMVKLPKGCEHLIRDIRQRYMRWWFVDYAGMGYLEFRRR